MAHQASALLHGRTFPLFVSRTAKSFRTLLEMQNFHLILCLDKLLVK